MNHEAVYRTAPATPGLLVSSRSGGGGEGGRVFTKLLKNMHLVLVWLLLTAEVFARGLQ